MSTVPTVPIAHLTHRIAIRVPWCQIVEGVVHTAIWTEYNGAGVLTTLVEDEATEEITCHFQTGIDFADLRHHGLLWRDRSTLGLPVCPKCEIDADWEAP